MTVKPEDLARALRTRARQRQTAEEIIRQRALVIARGIVSDATLPAEARVWLIGSLPWGGFGERSDIDMVFDGVERAEALALADRLGEQTGRHVDVLTLSELPDEFRTRVVSDGSLLRGT